MSANSLTSKHWRVDWVELGEGLNGDYDENDPNDIELLRFDFYCRPSRWAPWQEPHDSSYCTQVPANTPPRIRKRLLKILLAEVSDLPWDTPIKKLCERLSWINVRWLT